VPHQEALNAIGRINDACGHIMLEFVPFDQATAHILAVPSFDLAELLRAMRRQSSRAALHLQAAGARAGRAEDVQEGESEGRPEARDQGENADQQAAKPALKPPPDEAVKAYRLKWILGVPKQTEIAKTLSQELGKPVGQGQVSRWLKQAAEFVNAGGVLSDLPGLPSKKPMPVDPERLDLGPRQDGRTERQRERRSDDD
jgi:hypothetical protein